MVSVLSRDRYWFGEINWEIWHHGQFRSVNFPNANMMLNRGDLLYVRLSSRWRHQ